MAVVKMKKLSVFAHKRDADRLLHRLMRLRCVEIKQSELDDGVSSGEIPEHGFAEIENNIAGAARCLKVLSKYSERKKGLGSARISVRLDKFRSDGSYARAVAVVGETDELLAKKDELKGIISKERAVLASLEPWQEYELPFDYEGTEKTVTIPVTLPPSVVEDKIEEVLSDIEAGMERVGGGKSVACYALTAHVSALDEALRRLGAIGMLRVPFEGTSATAIKLISERKKAIGAAEKGLQDIEKRLRELAKDIEYPEILYDAESTSLVAEKAKAKLASTEQCVNLQGWVPENETERVSGALSKMNCAFEIEEPGEDEEPPVLLRNNFFARTFEWVLGMYSYPKYGTYDPTFIMSIFYFIIFGLMFADVGYGFILVVGCFGALKFLNPRGGMRNFLAMFGYCGISSMAMGVLFGAYFGNLPQAFSEYMLGVEGATTTMQTAVLFDPMADPMSFLILSLAIGAVHLIAGMAVQFCILCKKGQWVDALCDIATWWLTFAGIGLMVLFPWGKYVALAGVASIVLTGGRREKNVIMKLAKGLLALYGAVNYAADLLSYSRILALGLAASVIAQVINTMGTMGGPSVVGFIMMILVFIVGHLLNLAINVLGTFVHTSRLQYIEFFGKFFEDGGKPFKPAEPSDKYTTEQ